MSSFRRVWSNGRACAELTGGWCGKKWGSEHTTYNLQQLTTYKLQPTTIQLSQLNNKGQSSQSVKQPGWLARVQSDSSHSSLAVSVRQAHSGAVWCQSDGTGTSARAVRGTAALRLQLHLYLYLYLYLHLHLHLHQTPIVQYDNMRSSQEVYSYRMPIDCCRCT
jgi:hypothetical protein